MMRSSEPFHHFVDDYLAYLHEVHPTGATLDGIHTYDDHIEDFSRQAIEQHTRALSGFARRLQDINHNDLTAVEKAEQPMVAANIQARMFELEQIRTWERNPQLYSDTLCSSLAAQVVFTHAPLPERARRVLSKLRQTARVVQAARDNIKDPPGIFVKVGLETFRGALNFIEKDLPRAFSALDDMHLLGDLADASTEAVAGDWRATSSTSRKTRRPRRAPRSGWGAICSSGSWRSTRGSRWMPIGCSPSRCGNSRRRRTSFDRSRESSMAAIRSRPGAKRRTNIPRRARLSAAAQQQLEELSTFIDRNGIVTRPEGGAGHRRADARVLSMVVREHVGAGPVRAEGDARVLLPDRRRSLMACRQAGRAPARFQLPDALGDLDSRGVSGPFSPLPVPAAGRVEGPQVHHVFARLVRRRAGRITPSR